MCMAMGLCCHCVKSPTSKTLWASGALMVKVCWRWVSAFGGDGFRLFLFDISFSGITRKHGSHRGRGERHPLSLIDAPAFVDFVLGRRDEALQGRPEALSRLGQGRGECLGLQNGYARALALERA